MRPGGADSSDPYVSDARDLATWFDGRPADIVLHALRHQRRLEQHRARDILNAYTAILNKLRMRQPERARDGRADHAAAAVGLQRLPDARAEPERADPGWAAANSTAASPITVVDQFTGFNPAMGQDTSDGVHPNASGSTKIAAKWFARAHADVLKFGL